MQFLQIIVSNNLFHEYFYSREFETHDTIFYPSIWSLNIPYIENKVNFSLTSTETSQKNVTKSKFDENEVEF